MVAWESQPNPKFRGTPDLLSVNHIGLHLLAKLIELTNNSLVKHLIRQKEEKN